MITVKKSVNQVEKKVEQKLQTRWEAAYKRFEFDSGVIKGVVKKLEIQVMLKELSLRSGSVTMTLVPSHPHLL